MSSWNEPVDCAAPTGMSDGFEFPEFDTAEDAGRVVDEFDAMPQVDLELLRVAAADVEPIDVEQRVEHLDGFQHAFAPAPVSDPATRCIPEFVLERSVTAERHEREFEMR